MVVLLAPWIVRYRKHRALVGFTKGATAAAAGAITGAAAVIASNVLVDWAAVAIFAVAGLVLWRTKLPEPLVVAGSAVCGILIIALR
jgi:chromate transporter